MNKPKIGITLGDVNGIGPEVIIKTLTNKKIAELCTPIIYGSAKAVSYHRNIVKNNEFSFLTINQAGNAVSNRVNVINCWEESVNISLGQITEDGGKYAHISLDRATNDIKEGIIDLLVTAPINKKAMESSLFHHVGHTEYLSSAFDVETSLMMMVSENIKLGLVTNHIPVANIASSITVDIINKKLGILHDTLKKDFGYEKPRIGVLGLNPHAGDEGRIGSEESLIIAPAIQNSKDNGILVFGPYAADGYFGSGTYRKFDATLAMYHDQGLIPFKTVSFGRGVNFTAGLPIIRTSPDHGTGYDIVGQNIADESSFREAIFLGIDLWRNRQNFQEMHSQALEKKPKLTEEFEE